MVDAACKVMPQNDVAADTEIETNGLPVNGTGSGVAVPSSNQNSEKRDFSTAPTYWYVARVKSYQGKHVRRYLRNKSLPIDVWIATQSIESKWTDRTKKVERYHFPSYLFFKMQTNDVNEKLVFREVCATPYVYSLLTAPGESEPAKIPDRQIMMFRQMLSDELRPVSIVGNVLCKGDKVRVTGIDHMRDVEGYVEKLSPNEANIYVTIGHLGYATLKIERKYLTPIVEKSTEKREKPAKPAADIKITAEDWLALHPYHEMMPADRQYVAFANGIVEYLASPLLRIYREKRKHLALRLASYVEDKRSGLCLFTTFVALTRKEKKFHPVADLLAEQVCDEDIEVFMADYNPKSVNAIDLCYFLFFTYNDKNISPAELFTQGTRICKALKNMGCAKWPENELYVEDTRKLLLSGEWRGLKHFLLWVACGRHYLSPQGQAESLSTIISSEFKAWGGVNPLAFALTFVRKSRLGNETVKSIESVKVIKPTEYDVIDDDYAEGESVGRKNKRFVLKRTGSGHNSTQYAIRNDEVSTTKYAVGEICTCQLVRYGDEWHIVAYY